MHRAALAPGSAGLPSERVSLQSLEPPHGPVTHGSLLLLMAALCLLPVPGVGTALGVGLAGLAIAMWRGQVAEHLPARVARLELPRRWAQRVLKLLATTYAAAGRLATAQLTDLASAGRRSWTVAHGTPTPSCTDGLRLQINPVRSTPYPRLFRF